MATVFAYLPHLPPREAIEAAIETLLTVLDASDGDPDIEEDDHSGGNVTYKPHDGCTEDSV
jgi:hypothetical protein